MPSRRTRLSASRSRSHDADAPEEALQSVLRSAEQWPEAASTPPHSKLRGESSADRLCKNARNCSQKLLCIVGLLPISRYAQVRVAWHDIALKRDRSNTNMAGSGLGPAEMKHRACIS